MSIFDRFKKSKKESDKKKSKEVKKAKPKKKSIEKKGEPDITKQSLDEVLQKPALPAKQGEPAKSSVRRIEKKQFSEAWRVLQSTHVTEKSAKLAEEGVYVFKIGSFAGKQEIKKAVQDLYGVKVEKVRVVSIPRKSRRLGKSQGYKSGYKKAMVKLAEGEKIEIMPR